MTAGSSRNDLPLSNSGNEIEYVFGRERIQQKEARPP